MDGTVAGLAGLFSRRCLGVYRTPRTELVSGGAVDLNPALRHKVLAGLSLR